MHICIMSRTITEFCDTKEMRQTNPSLFFFLPFLNNFSKYVSVRMYLENQASQTSISMTCNSKFSQHGVGCREKRFHVHPASLRVGFHNKKKNEETVSSTFTANGICYRSLTENVQYFLSVLSQIINMYQGIIR